MTLRLSGSRAGRGLPLSDLETFVKHFTAALRGHERVRRDEPARKTGHPERRSESAVAFRLVGLEPGSALLTLEPMGRSSETDDSLFDAEGELAMSNLVSLVGRLETRAEIDPDVVDALGSATRSLGDGGRIELDVLAEGARTRVSVDEALLRSVERTNGGGVEEIGHVSGRLHMIDLEPDRVGIRAPNGMEWTCHYPDDLEERIKQLVDQAVVATGSGRKVSAQRGTMALEDIAPAVEHRQDTLFTAEQVPLAELMAQQGIAGPQGLGSLGDPEWEDDEEGRRFLEELLGRA